MVVTTRRLGDILLVLALAACGGSAGSAVDASGDLAPDGPADVAEAPAGDLGDAPGNDGADTAPEVAVEPAPPPFPTGARLDYPNLLELRNTPVGPLDPSAMATSDAGAWHGFALPSADRPDLLGGFVGPLQHRPQSLNDWLGESVLVVRLLDDAGVELPYAEDPDAGVVAWPGALVQRLHAGDVAVELALAFTDARTSLVRLVVRAPADRPATVRLGFRGGVSDLGTARLGVAGGRVTASVPGQDDAVMVALPADLAVAVAVAPDGLAWTGRPATPVVLAAGGTLTRFLGVVRCLDAAECATRADGLDGALAGGAPAFAANDARWNGWLASVLTPGNPWTADADHRAVAVKALETLAYDWRGAWRDMKHDGLWPSSGVMGFHGLWAWDSWKHAVALARFAPDLAKSQVRAMLDWQRDDGMVPDTVTPDHTADYWFCTKPPLAAWAVAEIQARAPDAAFLAEVVPKILKYHRWRYATRDHDGNGLCEYGSSHDVHGDGGNDSGMDNAMRFDGATLVQNGPDSWSFDQESVDLNAYLWADKRFLADLYDALGDGATAATLRAEADTLKAQILATFWDDATGWFYDVRLADRSFVRVQGPEGWTPLFVGLATPEQAARVRAQLVDPAKFWTPVPFPSVAADTPGWDPLYGYWRGPVWLDQAWFGAKALERYGFADDAREAARRMIEVPEGLYRATGSIRENYDPQNGAGSHATDFGWSAAHLLLLFAP